MQNNFKYWMVSKQILIFLTALQLFSSSVLHLVDLFYLFFLDLQLIALLLFFLFQSIKLHYSLFNTLMQCHLLYLLLQFQQHEVKK